MPCTIVDGSETRSIGGMHRLNTTWPIGQTWSCSLNLPTRSRRGKEGEAEGEGNMEEIRPGEQMMALVSCFSSSVWEQHVSAVLSAISLGR